MLRVKGLDHVVLSVKDVEASLAFYHGILGMEALRVEEYRQGKVGFPSIRASETSIIDLQKPKAVQGGADGHPGKNMDHFCLLIEPTDIDKLAGELRAHGVAIEGPPGQRWGAQGRGPSLYVQDPDGNTVELKCYAKEPAVSTPAGASARG